MLYIGVTRKKRSSANPAVGMGTWPRNRIGESIAAKERRLAPLSHAGLMKDYGFITHFPYDSYELWEYLTFLLNIT
jgi:hypothetical protein